MADDDAMLADSGRGVRNILQGDWYAVVGNGS